MSTLKADTITAKSTNTNVTVVGAGTGKVALGDGTLLFPDADGSANQPIITNGSATLSFGTLPIAGGGTGSTSTTYCSLTANVTGTMPIANGGTGSTSTTYCDLTANVTGATPVANGGTGATTATAGFDALSPMTAEGDIVYGGTSGTVTKLAKGSNDEVLTLASGVPSWAAAGGGGSWNLIGTSAASDSASLTVTGIDATYDSYAMAFTDIIFTNSGESMYIRIGDSGGIKTDSNYDFHLMKIHANSDTYTATFGTGSPYFLVAQEMSNATGECTGGMLFLHNAGAESIQPILSGTWTQTNSSSLYRGGYMGGRYGSALSVTQLQLLAGYGNIASGRFTVWGIAHA